MLQHQHHYQHRSNEGFMSRIPLQGMDMERRQRVLWGQLQHHRQLRRQSRFLSSSPLIVPKPQNQQQQPDQQSEEWHVSEAASSFVSWRLALRQLDATGNTSAKPTNSNTTATAGTKESSNSTGETSSDSTIPNMMGTVALSNCHFVLYTGQISIGTPPQTVR
jgi:hypothetical protein